MGRPCRLIVVTVLSVVLGGCYAYRGGAIQPIDPSTFAVPRMERVVVSTVKVESNTGGDTDLAGMTTRQLEEALRIAGADVKPSGAVANPDATLTVAVQSKGSVVAQLLSGAICGLTLLVVPGYAGLDVSLDVDAVTRDGSRRHYHYADTCSLWIELFLLPVSNSPDRVIEDLIADMSRSVARDLQRDGVLPQPGTAALAPFHLTDDLRSDRS